MEMCPPFKGKVGIVNVCARLSHTSGLQEDATGDTASYCSHRCCNDLYIKHTVECCNVYCLSVLRHM
jgi:hypothetical protein